MCNGEATEKDFEDPQEDFSLEDIEWFDEKEKEKGIWRGHARRLYRSWTTRMMRGKFSVPKAASTGAFELQWTALNRTIGDLHRGVERLPFRTPSEGTYNREIHRNH